MQSSSVCHSSSSTQYLHVWDISRCSAAASRQLSGCVGFALRELRYVRASVSLTYTAHCRFGIIHCICRMTITVIHDYGHQIGHWPSVRYSQPAYHAPGAVKATPVRAAIYWHSADYIYCDYSKAHESVQCGIQAVQSSNHITGCYCHLIAVWSGWFVVESESRLTAIAAVCEAA